MTTLEIDDDFNFVDAETLQILDGCDEIVQNTRVCLSLVLGESCVFPEAGVDYTSAIMRDERFAAQILASKILSIDGIDAVGGFSINVDENRNTRFTTGVTIDGTVLDLAV